MKTWNQGLLQYVEELDIEDDFEVAAHHRVRSVPCVIVLGDDGAEVARYGATVTENQLQSHLVM